MDNNYNVNQQIREMIFAKFPVAGRHTDLSDDDSLFSKGIIDSLGVLELVASLEEKFNVLIAEEDLVPENFESIANLSTFVQSKSTEVVAL